MGALGFIRVNAKVAIKSDNKDDDKVVRKDNAWSKIQITIPKDVLFSDENVIFATWHFLLTNEYLSATM